MSENLLTFVKAELASINPVDFARVATSTSVPESTIRKIHYGEVVNPRIGTVQPLYDYFKRQRGKTARQAA